MMASNHLAASVKQRLLNLSRERGLDFNLVLTRYGVERILYRLSCSNHRDEFVLKGAMLFHLWSDAPHRPTRDVDLLGEEGLRLREVVEFLAEFLQPPLAALRAGDSFDLTWPPGGPWRTSRAE